MIGAGTGLTPVSTDALIHLLRLTYRQELTFPLTITELTRVGLQSNANSLLGQLRGLEATGTKAVLVSVLAERKARDEDRPVGIATF